MKWYPRLQQNGKKMKKKHVKVNDWNVLILFFVCLMVFNATFNNISVISLRSVLLMEETGGPRENHRPVAYHIILYTSPWWLFDLQLPVQSVPITTEVVSSNSIHGEIYSIQHYAIKLVSDLRQAGDFPRVLRFPPPIKLIATI